MMMMMMTMTMMMIVEIEVKNCWVNEDRTTTDGEEADRRSEVMRFAGRMSDCVLRTCFLLVYELHC